MKSIALILAALLYVTPAGAQTEKKDRPNIPPVKSPAKKEAKKPETPPETPAKPVDINKVPAYREYLQALQYESEGNFIQAVESYKKVIELDQYASEPHVALGELYFRNRNLRDAETEGRFAIKLNKDSIGGHRLVGRILATESLTGAGNKEKLQEAIVHFLEVTRIEKQDPEAWKILGTLYSSINENDKALEAYQNLISTGLASFPDYFEMARLYYSKGQYREASQAARQAFEQSENNPQAGLLLSDSLLRSGQTAEAIEILKLISRDNPNSLGLALGLAEALVQAGRYDEATQNLNRVLENDAKNLRALNLLAQVQRRQGKREDAIKTLKRALEGQDITDSLEIQFELAETYEELGQYDNAVAAYEEALTALLNPDGTVSDSNRRNAGIVMQAIALAYRSAGQRDKTLQTIERMRKVLGPDSIVPDQLLIDTHRTDGKYQEAVDVARAAQKRFPKERRFKFLEAQSLSQLQKVDEAVAVLKTLFNGGAEDADVHHFTSFILLDNNKLDEAERNVRKALQFDTKNISYLITLSSIQDRGKKYKESEETLRYVLQLDPDNATALNNLGYFLTERNERLNEALGFIQRAVNIEPSNSSFLDSLGWIYYKMGNLEMAKKYLEESIVHDRRSATVREHLGDLYHRLGRTEDAIKQWQLALELTHDKEEIARLKDKIRDPKNATAKQ